MKKANKVSIVPNMNNILPQYKHWIIEPTTTYKELGIIVAICYDSACPWCDCEMTFGHGKLYIATCNSDPQHKAQWLPLGA